MSYLLVFLGAGLGGVCRFLMSTSLQKWMSSSGNFGMTAVFPIGTFCVNMLGCFIIGMVAQLAETRAVLQGDTRLFLTVGILGGFTTFSSFGYETVSLVKDGEIVLAMSNACGQLILGLFFVWLGMIIGKLI